MKTCRSKTCEREPSPTRPVILPGFLSFQVKAALTWVYSLLCESCCLPSKTVKNNWILATVFRSSPFQSVLIYKLHLLDFYFRLHPMNLDHIFWSMIHLHGSCWVHLHVVGVWIHIGTSDNPFPMSDTKGEM